MRTNGHARYYDRLTPEERFRLDILAMARGDMQESERLTRTCPRETYTMNDRAYTGRWHGSVEITLRACAALNTTLAKLQMIDAFRALIPYSQTLAQNAAFDAYLEGHEAGSCHAWKYAGMEGRPPAWPSGPDDEELLDPDEDERDPAMERDLDELGAKVEKYGALLPELMDRLERNLAAEGLAVWEAFAAFCEEDMGLEAEKMLGVIAEPIASWVIERVEKLKAVAEGQELEGNPEIFEACREGFGESWRVACERGV